MIDHIVDKEIFLEVLRTGVTSRSEHFTLYRMNVSKDTNSLKLPNCLKVGIVVPKRLAKKAVTRNAIKRQAYSVANKFAELFPEEFHVIRLNREFDRKKYLSPSSIDFKLDVCNELKVLYKIEG